MEMQEKMPSPSSQSPRQLAGTNRCLFCVVVVLLLLSSGMAIGLVFVLTRSATLKQPQTQQPPEDQVCLSPGCVVVASRLLSYSDAATPPCDDFFQHACGSWRRQAHQQGLGDDGAGYSINVDQVNHGVDWRIRELLQAPEYQDVPGFKKAQDFFSYCVRELPATKRELQSSAEHIVKHVLGGFRSSQDWSSRPVELTSLLVHLNKLLGTPLFDISRSVDPKNHSQTAFLVSPAAFETTDSRSLQGRLSLFQMHRKLRIPKRRGRAYPELGRAAAGSSLGRPWDSPKPRGRASRRRQQRAADSETTLEPRPGAELLSEPVSEEAEERDVEGAETADEAGFGGDGTVESSQLFQALEWREKEERRNKSLRYFLYHSRLRNASSEFSERDLEQLDELLTMLEKFKPTSQDKAAVEADSHLTYSTQMTVNELQTGFSQLNWTRLLAEVLETDVTGSDTVYVSFPGYLNDVSIILDLFPPWTVHNALLLLYRTEELDGLIEELAAAESSDSKRSSYCADTTTQLFPVSVGGMFVREAGRARVERLRGHVSEIMSAVKAELVRSIERQAGLSASALGQKMLRKVRSARSLLVASDKFWEDSFIDDHAPDFSRLTHSEEEELPGRHHRHHLLQLLQTLSDVRSFITRKHLSSVQRQTDEEIWSYVVQPFIPNAFYIPDYNTVVIPLGFLSGPYYYDDVPDVITFSLVGAALAHELLHSIGVSGLNFDSGGTLRPLSEAEQKQLESMRECMLHQYTANLSRQMELGGFTFSTQLSSLLTLDENLSDHSGVALAWRAFDRWRDRRSAGDAPLKRRHSSSLLPGISLDDKQIFMLSLAQSYCAVTSPLSYVMAPEMVTHLPNRERVTAMMRHWQGFSSAFNCPAGSAMIPEDRCGPLW